MAKMEMTTMRKWGDKDKGEEDDNNDVNNNNKDDRGEYIVRVAPDRHKSSITRCDRQQRNKRRRRQWIGGIGVTRGERQHNNQPDKRHKRSATIGSGATRGGGTGGGETWA